MGEYSIDVELEGYNSDGPKTVTVTEVGTSAVAFTLSQQVGRIEVTSTPSGAKIFVNGTDTGKVTPSTLSDQPVGNYSVDVQLEGYGSDGPKDVTVSTGQTSGVDFSLSQNVLVISGKVTGVDSVTVTIKVVIFRVHRF